MSLLEEIEEATSGIAIGGKCSVSKTLNDMEDKDRDSLALALEKRDKYPGTAISTALKKRGVQLTSQAIQRHRRGVCSCQKTQT